MGRNIFISGVYILPRWAPCLSRGLFFSRFSASPGKSDVVDPPALLFFFFSFPASCPDYPRQTRDSPKLLITLDVSLLTSLGILGSDKGGVEKSLGSRLAQSRFRDGNWETVVVSQNIRFLGGDWGLAFYTLLDTSHRSPNPRRHGVVLSKDSRLGRGETAGGAGGLGGLLLDKPTSRP